MQTDLVFRQRQELYERRHGGSGLQGKKRVEKVSHDMWIILLFKLV